MLKLIGITVGAVAMPLSAQSLNVQYHLAFREVDAVTGELVPSPNGIIEPGEAALFSLSFSFSPAVGASVPGFPGYHVHAFANTWLNITNASSVPGTWANLALAQGWDFEPAHPGYPEPQWGGVILIRPSQNHINADQSNPVLDVWQARWTPGDYTPRAALFRAVPTGLSGGAGLWAQETANPENFIRVQTFAALTDLHVPIVPAPGAGAVIGFGMLGLTRRRR